MINLQLNLTEEELRKLYVQLPSASNARSADNPSAFQQFVSRNGSLGNDAFDNAILCRDRLSGAYTWHVLCDEYGLAEIRTSWTRQLAIEPRIRKLRHGRDLQCVEVVTRDNRHYFLEE